MACRITRSILKYRKLVDNTQSFRTILSAAYRCDDVWNQRLDSPLLANINASDFAYELDRKYKREGKVSAIDVDLFVNRLEPTYARDLTHDLEELIRWLRRSPETINTLSSTPHAALRILFDTRRTKLLLTFLTNPLYYGIFPDYYMANLLMSTYIEEKNYTAAARVASVLMLQEDFGPPLTVALSQLSCYLYLKSENNLPWEDYAVKLEEPSEEVKIKVKYLRNHYFDDHFDLKDPNHIVGKTLAWGAPLIEEQIGLNLEILGWATYKKWTDLEVILKNTVERNIPVASCIVSSLKNILNSVENGEYPENINHFLSQLESQDSKVQEIDIESLLRDMVQREFKKTETIDIKNQEEIYASWVGLREKEVNNQIEEYKKREILAEIEEKKKDLDAKEEVIFFFDKKDRLEMLLDKKPIPREKSRTHFFSYKKKAPKKVDEDYIPPEVIRR